MPKTKHTLYLCYFGLREPLVQTQVLPYLRELKKIDDLQVSLLTFEPNFKKTWNAEQIEIERQTLAREDIDWHALPYHKRPTVPATLYDILNGALFVLRLARREKIDIIHARSHIPAMMGAIVKRFCGGKLLFDIRGFLPEEYTDAGVWKENGIIFKTVKFIEKRVLKKSDGFVVLTEKAREAVFPESRETGFDKFGRPVEVIPCCVEMNRFNMVFDKSARNNLRREFELENKFVITHVGSLGGLYMTDEIADFYATAKNNRPETFALVLTQSNPELIVPLLKQRGFTEEEYLVKKVSPPEVPNYLMASDLALSFVKATFATISRSPTKIPEYLICGVPIISNSGIGDVDEQLNNDKVGVIIKDFSVDNYEQALLKIADLHKKDSLAEKCQTSAMNRFDLEKIGGERYRKLYQRLLINDGKLL